MKLYDTMLCIFRPLLRGDVNDRPNWKTVQWNKLLRSARRIKLNSEKSSTLVHRAYNAQTLIIITLFSTDHCSVMIDAWNLRKASFRSVYTEWSNKHQANPVFWIISQFLRIQVCNVYFFSQLYCCVHFTVLYSGQLWEHVMCLVVLFICILTA